MSVVLVGLQCQLDSPSPSVSILRQMVQFLHCLQCILAPVFYVVRPFSAWSCSFVLCLHYSEHHCLKFPVVTHCGDMSKHAGSFYALLLFAESSLFCSLDRKIIVSFVILSVHFIPMI